MNRKGLSILAAVLIILSFAGTSLGWQGRMAGMGDPSGLVSDESDFFVHPAKIVDGSGNNYYADYRFNYIQVTKWNNIFTFAPTPGTSFQYPFMATGSERDHDMSLGGTWSFGPGRLGLFIKYSTKDGSFNGTDYNGVVGMGVSSYDTFSFDTDRRSFDVKLFYGLPLGAWKLGSELAVGHRTYFNSTTQTIGSSATILNNPIGARNPQYNTFPYMIPTDWRWKEASFKVSAESAVGPGLLTFTPKIATVFHGTSEYNNRFLSGSTAVDDIHNTGSLKGWSTRGDLWYRIKFNESIAMPLVTSVSYDRIRSEIHAYDSAVLEPVDISSEARAFVFELGGGIDTNFMKGSKIAAGLYYNYRQSKTMFMYDYLTGPHYIVANNETPLEKENRIVLKTACEHAYSPTLKARAGIDAFYGWVKDNYDFTNTLAGFDFPSQQVKTSGHRWGLSAAAGATMKVSSLIVEPFINGGLQKTKLDNSSGSYSILSVTLYDVNLRTEKSEWNIGGGVSIKY